MRLAVEEVVDRLVAVAAGDDDGGRAELVEALGELAAVLAVEAGERLGLGQVRRHDRREREQPRDERLDRVVLRAGARRSSRP